MTDKEKDKQTEKALLGTLLMKPEIYKKLDINIDDFYFKENQRIFHVIGEMNEDGLIPDMVSVGSELIKRNLIETIGGGAYLASLTDDCITDHWPSYVRVIKEKSGFRKLIMVGLKIQQSTKNGSMNPDINQIYEEIKQIRGLMGITDTSIAYRVREWVLVTSGSFLVTDCYRDLGLVTSSHKQAARMALIRLREEGVIVECGDKRGCYRPVENDAPEIDWQDADTDTVYDLKWPFALETMVNIYPKNIIILAGASNAGKTAFLLNFVKMNLDQHKIRFLSSEMGPEEMKLRITKFADYDPRFWKGFKPRERAGNFADAISPSQVNIIDYYEISDNFYSIGGELRAIHDKLKSGIALIAIQKKGNQELGRGAEFSLEKPRLYLSMNPGELKIVKGKNWARPGWNPNGMTFKYKLINGCEFLEYE